MSGSQNPEVSATGFAPHIEELHEFFRSRGVVFGEPDDLKAFVDRLSTDESFRDQMASMVRAIIYRERDGLTPAELMELLVTAVTGTSAENVPEPLQDALRQMTGFAASVFRSRWNPGGPVATGDKVNTGTSVVAEAPAAQAKDAADAAARPMTPMFYQAQVVAMGGEKPEAVKDPVLDTTETAESETAKPEVAEEQEIVLPLRGTAEDASEPTLSLAGYAAQGDPVVAFVRGDEEDTIGREAARRRPSGWMWAAATLAVVIAFCAGMFTRQWMVTRYGPAWPWHVPAPWATIHGAPPRAVPPAAVAAPPPSGSGAEGASAPQTRAQRKPAQVEAARSAWSGGTESASDLEPPSGAATPQPKGGGGASTPQPAASAVSTTPAAASAANPSPEVLPSDLTSARITAMVGASPALMESHLVYAPEPEYPKQARMAHIQGPVVVETLVGRDGRIVTAHAISGPRLLRASAEDAVYGRRYRPYVVNDIPMAVRTLVTIDFRLP